MCEQHNCHYCGEIDRMEPIIILHDAIQGKVKVCEDCAVDRYGMCAVCLEPCAGEYDDFAATHDNICFECWQSADD